MNYMLENIDAEMATVVLVRNALDSKPTAPCGAGAGAAGKTAAGASPGTADPTFVYRPWQFLNPSFGAIERFSYGNVLSVVAEKVTAGGTIYSKQTPVYAGSSYMLVIGETGIQVVFDRQNGKDYVEIATPTSSVDPFSVNVVWHVSGLNLSDSQSAGLTQNVGPNTCVYFQPDNDVLLFLPVDASKAAITYSPADVSPATPYRPPAYATQVRVTLRLDDAGKSGYAFDPPNALPSG